MVKIDFDLIQEVRETADWLLEFPENLVSAILKPREEYLRRRDRIHKLKEIVELREIAKAVQRLYISKGSLVHWIQELQSEHKFEDAKYVREVFQAVYSGIDNLKEAVGESSISDTSLGAEAAMFLSRAALAYRQLAELPDEALLDDRAVAEIAALLERMTDSASALVRKLDEYRKLLDHTYGD